MKQILPLIALVVAPPAFATEMRHLDAHEHGVGALNIAIDGTTVAMEFQAPGADIVGFEHPAESEADLAAIAAATATLSAPLDLFVVPKAAACVVTQARAEIEGDEDHDEDHHEGHDEDDHAGAEHKDHDEDHADATGHTEFHAEYTLTCTQPDALTKITFAYFDVFPNAKGVDVQMITTSGAQAFDVGHDAPVLDLGR